MQKMETVQLWDGYTEFDRSPSTNAQCGKGNWMTSNFAKFRHEFFSHSGLKIAWEILQECETQNILKRRSPVANTPQARALEAKYRTCIVTHWIAWHPNTIHADPVSFWGTTADVFC